MTVLVWHDGDSESKSEWNYFWKRRAFWTGRRFLRNEAGSLNWHFRGCCCPNAKRFSTNCQKLPAYFLVHWILKFVCWMLLPSGEEPHPRADYSVWCVHLKSVTVLQFDLQVGGRVGGDLPVTCWSVGFPLRLCVVSSQRCRGAACRSGWSSWWCGSRPPTVSSTASSTSG